jgi:hypothetical protein
VTDASRNICSIALTGLLWLPAGCAGDDPSDDTTQGSTGHSDTHSDDASSSSESEGGAPADDSSSGAGTESSGAASSESGGATMDTWESWAYPEYFTPYCIECHPGESARDFSMYEVVVENVVHIRCGSAPEMLPDCDDHIEPGHLPIGDGPFPTDDERWRLVAWIDAGMPRDP